MTAEQLATWVPWLIGLLGTGGLGGILVSIIGYRKDLATIRADALARHEKTEADKVVEADKADVAATLATAELHRVALEAAHQSSEGWKELTGHMRNVEFPALRKDVQDCREREERATVVAHERETRLVQRIDRLEGEVLTSLLGILEHLRGLPRG